MVRSVEDLTPEAPLARLFKRISIDARTQDSGMEVVAMGSSSGKAVRGNPEAMSVASSALAGDLGTTSTP